MAAVIFPTYDKLPSQAPVLVTRLNVGHRPIHSRPACGSRERTNLASAQQALAWSVMPCGECWKGRTPW